jgi:hypothetical protein
MASEGLGGAIAPPAFEGRASRCATYTGREPFTPLFQKSHEAFTDKFVALRRILNSTRTSNAIALSMESGK